MILARITSQYGDVYLRAMDSSDRRSSPERFMSNGLVLGIDGDYPPTPAYQITSPHRDYKYVIVFTNKSTKPWSVEIPMQNTNGPIDEYPCKEGNYALADILAGARAEEKSATSKQGSR